MGKERLSDLRLRGARGAILGFLRAADHTVAEIAREVGLTPNGVRLHLERLEAEGLVESVGTAPGPTKSSRVYGLSAEGRRMYSRAYAAFLGALVAELIARGSGSRGGATGVTGAPGDGPPENARALFAAVARRLGPAGRAGDRAARLGQALDRLRDLGGQPVVEATASATAITLPQCPLSDLSSLHPEMCEFGRALLAEWTGEPVAVRCERGDRPRCRFELAGTTAAG